MSRQRCPGSGTSVAGPGAYACPLCGRSIRSQLRYGGRYQLSFHKREEPRSRIIAGPVVLPWRVAMGLLLGALPDPEGFLSCTSGEMRTMLEAEIERRRRLDA